MHLIKIHAMPNNTLEYWLQGPIEGVPPLLQPVAHALLQSNAEIQDIIKDFPKENLWLKPAGVASIAFHLQHIAGVLDRLFTYSKGDSLTEAQLHYLSNEGKENDALSPNDLTTALQQQIDTSIEHLKTVHEDTLTQARFVGRKQLPST